MDALERFVYIILMVVIYCYSNYNECDDSNKQGQCNLRPCNRLLKRDFKYCTFIMIALLVLILTAKVGNDSNLLAYISFGSTLSSIILSILAIFMTMLSESKNDATKTRLENLTSTIENASESIKEQADSIKKIYDEMTKRFAVYENIAKQQINLMEKLESLDERTKNIEDGIKTKNFEGNTSAWDAKKKILRDKDGEK